MAELFTPPRFFKDVNFHRHTDRAVGWLELFYDLVYVATLIQIGNFLSDNLNIIGFGQFLVLITVVWWAWTGETFYQNRYVVDDIIHRILVFIQIFAVATLGLSVSAAFGDLYVQFTLAYVLTRFILVVMYWRAYRHHEASRAFSRGYITGFSIGIVIWLCSLLLPAELHWVGWLAGISVELAVPLLPRMRQEQLKWQPDVHHITERFGIFTIIVLGESFVKILDDSQGTAVGIDQLLFGTFGIIIVYSLWWLYFSDTADKIIDFSRSIKPITWVYGHLPFVAGLVAFGVAAKKMYGSTLDYADKVVNPDYRLLYMVSIVLYLVALALIDIGIDDETTHQSQNRESFIHLLSAGVVIIIGLAVTEVVPVIFVTLIAAVMVGQVIFSVIQERQIQRVENPPH